MSLQIAIQQIQPPGFWGVQQPKPAAVSKTNRCRSAESTQRRTEIMKILRAAGKPMDYATLSELTGWSLFSLRNMISPLVADGQIMRSRSYGKNGRAMVEAI